MTRNSPTLHGEMPEGHAEINPDDGRELGLLDKDFARIISRRGEVTTRVIFTDHVSRGMVFMSFHFMEANAMY